jgi:ElaB/YqjD/DUF883 family membrane-anchored ribosome-binding protein
MDEPTQTRQRNDAGMPGSPIQDASAYTSSDAVDDRGLMERIRERASAEFAHQKDRAVDGLHSAAEAVRRTTQQLSETRQEDIAEYARRGADRLDRLSERLTDRNVRDLWRDAQDFARRRPAIVIGSAFAIGVLTGRFLKSSRPSVGQ